jgi:hypothetical protein
MTPLGWIGMARFSIQLQEVLVFDATECLQRFVYALLTKTLWGVICIPRERSDT